MRYLILTTFIITAVSLNLLAQQDISIESDVKKAKVIRVMPRFYDSACEGLKTDREKKECADRKMLEFIYKNLRYPREARMDKIEGTVVISFVVDDLGFLTNFEITRDIGGGCGEEALRIAKSFPQPWEPGLADDVPVDVHFNLPVKFRLE